MKTPGATATHAVITDMCRANRGNDGAFDEAVRRLKEQYDACLIGRSGEKNVHYHLILSVESERHRTQVNQ